jgi:hypothetical protein
MRVLLNIISDERMRLSILIVASPRQHSHSQDRVPRDPQPPFTVSDSKLTQLTGAGPHEFISLRNRVPWLYPQALGSLFPASFDSGIWYFYSYSYEELFLLEVNWRFGGTWFHIQGRGIREEESNTKQIVSSVLSIFNPDEGTDFSPKRRLNFIGLHGIISQKI